MVGVGGYSVGSDHGAQEQARGALRLNQRQNLGVLRGGPSVVHVGRARPVCMVVTHHMTIRIMIGDARHELTKLADQSVHCCVTSPPYFGLRDYGVAGQIGLEPTPDAFVAEMVAVFREVRRVLRNDGTLWLNLGDSYNNFRVSKGPGQAVHGRDKLNGKPAPDSGRRGWHGLKEKDLIGIPWRVAFALQADGWCLRQDIIWSKPNPMPESVTDRCTKAHEYIFLLSKSARYFYDAEAIAEKPITPIDGRGSTEERKTLGHPSRYGDTESKSYRGKDWSMPSISAPGSGRNKRSVWTVTTQGFSEAHFATFPPALIEPCINAGCPEFTCGSCGTALDSSYGKAESNTNGTSVQDMQVVRRKGGAGPSQPRAQFLQQGLRLEVDGETSEHVEGFHHNVEGLQDAYDAKASERDAVRLCDGASPEHRSGHRSATTANGSGSPQGRESTEQRSVQSGSADKSQSRQTPKAQDGNDYLSSLRGADHHLALCPSCGASLDKVGIKPGLVLDCFGGAGTTGLVADRLQRSSILIELNPEYAAMAERRIYDDAPLFVEAAE